MLIINAIKLLQINKSLNFQICRKVHFRELINKSNLSELKDLTEKDFEDLYAKARKKFLENKLPINVNENGVFACNELALKEVDVYGFDYDFTIAFYKPSLDSLLYKLGRDKIVDSLKYPEEIKKLEYNSNFAVRGLHYDIEKGLLMKLDNFLQIQMDSVYRGATKVKQKEVLELYDSRILPQSYVEGTISYSTGFGTTSKTTNMIQLADLFSLPEMVLLCNITEYFVKNSIDYQPSILFHDVKESIKACHPVMHKTVAADPEEYIQIDPNTELYFNMLREAGKKLFLITNSPYFFVNKGFSFIIGPNWRDLFEVVIVQANKPRFFTNDKTPFRVFNEVTNSYLWDRVTKLEKGKVYYQGNVTQFQNLTGWRGNSVLYFGDQLYADLADLTLMHGWRTGAIIHELSHEISVINDKKFKENVNWLQMLTILVEEFQDVESEAADAALSKWKKECDEMRRHTKTVFNQQFGSVFRTYHNPSYFSRRLFRFADVYTSNLTNLLNYGPKHTFYPRRGVMPHEYAAYFM